MTTNDIERRLAFAETLILGPDDYEQDGLGRVRLKPHAVNTARMHPQFFGTCSPQTGIHNAYCRVCGEWLKWTHLDKRSCSVGALVDLRTRVSSMSVIAEPEPVAADG
jgi:hypothetical protein